MPTDRTISPPPATRVIVLNWNNFADTAACIASLRDVGQSGLQVVVVDNGSTDDSFVQLRDRFPDIPVLGTGTNLGFAGGVNFGLNHALRQSDWEFAWLLNNDTEVDPGALRAMLQAAQDNPRVGVVGAVLHDFADRGVVQDWGGSFLSTWTGMPRSARHPQSKINYICGASMLIRRSVLDDVGLFDPGFFFYFEDADFCFRAQANGWAMGVAEQARIYHKGSASILRLSLNQARYYRASQIRFLRKHGRFPYPAIVLTTLWRLLHSLALGQNDVFRGTCLGWREGWSSPVRTGR